MALASRETDEQQVSPDHVFCFRASVREVLADSELSAPVRVFCVATTHSHTAVLARLAGHIIPDGHSFIASRKFLHDLFTARRSSPCLVVMHDFYLCHSQIPSALFSGARIRLKASSVWKTRSPMRLANAARGMRPWAMSFLMFRPLLSA